MHKDAVHVLDLLKKTNLSSYIDKLKKMVYIPVEKLCVEIGESKEPIDYNDRQTLQYRTINEGNKWGEFFSCAWFHITGKVSDEVVKNIVDYVAILDIGGESCIYNDEGVVQGLTNVLGFPDRLQIIKGKKVVDLNKIGIVNNNCVEIWIDAGNNGKNYMNVGGLRFNKACIAKVRRDIIDYYYDFLALLQWYSIDKDRQRKTTILKALKDAVKKSGKLSVEEIQLARDELKPHLSAEKSNSDLTIYAVGHAHLDLAWLWPIRETKRKADRTFSNALINIEKYPNYIFGASQPQQFEWVKEKHPKLYEQIKQAVKDNRIELQGCMWVESDTNVPSGESLIRQIYYGQKFFKDEFGEEINTMWLPDAFGFTGALPQIMEKSGIKNFSTIKMSWNNVNKFPYNSFIWEGIDGSSVNVHMPPEGDYCSYGDPYAIKDIVDKYSEKNISKIALMPFGIGDGGAGPGEYHINMVSRLNGIEGLPKVKLASTKEFFDELNKEMSDDSKDFPHYQGELYLEKHRGTYTTQAKIKKYNRIAERDLRYTEWLLTLAYLKGMEYPHNQIDKFYKEHLFYMFHDILPGTSIDRVYKVCYERYPIMLAELKRLRELALSYLGDGSNKQYIINTSPFSRKGKVIVDGKSFNYNAQSYSSTLLVENSEQITYVYDQFSMENDNIKVKFNKNGEIVSYFDKISNHEAVKKGKYFNSFNVYIDRRMKPYDAWDIDPNYIHYPNRKMKLKNVKTYISNGTLIREQEYKYNKSTLKEIIKLDKDSEYLVFSCDADWHELHKMLRVEFYPADYADKVKCDIQFGYIERPATENDSVEKAQFEICAHKWVALDGEKNGFALINDCKYGHRVKNGLVSLNLLRAPVWPDKTADRGKHTFTFAVYAFEGKAIDSNLIKYGYELNREVEVIQGVNLPQIINLDNEAIILESIFVNDNGSIVLRLYESHGEKNTTNIKFNFDYKEVYESDMLTKKTISKLALPLNFTPFEVKTLVIEKK